MIKGKERNHKKTFTIALMAFAALFLMTGCESLFEEQKNKYELVAVKSSDLLEDTFYVKSGTDFYAVYNAKGNGVNSTLKVDPK